MCDLVFSVWHLANETDFFSFSLSLKVTERLVEDFLVWNCCWGPRKDGVGTRTRPLWSFPAGGGSSINHETLMQHMLRGKVLFLRLCSACTRTSGPHARDGWKENEKCQCEGLGAHGHAGRGGVMWLAQNGSCVSSRVRFRNYFFFGKKKSLGVRHEVKLYLTIRS